MENTPNFASIRLVWHYQYSIPIFILQVPNADFFHPTFCPPRNTTFCISRYFEIAFVERDYGLVVNLPKCILLVVPER